MLAGMRDVVREPYIIEIKFDEKNHMIVYRSDGRKIDNGYFPKHYNLVIEKETTR